MPSRYLFDMMRFVYLMRYLIFLCDIYLCTLVCSLLPVANKCGMEGIEYPPKKHSIPSVWRMEERRKTPTNSFAIIPFADFTTGEILVIIIKNKLRRKK